MDKKEMYLKALKSVKTIINAMYDLDRCYMENVETYQLMNDVLRNMVRGLIRAGNYRTFEEAESIEICKSLLLQKSYPNEKYLIDTVDETKFNY